ncbi:MAG: tetratricopeptide repeat protein [Geminocystis sp.]|nr:tetratricopeptide repeat protein [Geminocystis sp.]
MATTKQEHMDFERGKKLLETGNYEGAVRFFQKLAEENDNDSLIIFYLGLSYFLLGEKETANSLWMSVLLASEDFDRDCDVLLAILNEQGVRLLQRRQWLLALSVYLQIAELIAEEENPKPEWGVYYYNLAYNYERLGNINSAILFYQKSIDINPNLIDAYNNLGNIYFSLNQLEDAESIYRRAIQVNPYHSGSRFNLLLTLKHMGRNQEAVQLAEETSQLFPDDFIWHLQRHLYLPIIYTTTEEISYYRNRFSEGLDYLINSLNLATEERKRNALQAICNHTNFYLAYQGFNDVDLQKKYGKLVTTITRANYPKWFEKRNPATGGKIRLGFVTGASSNRAKWLLKWIENLDKSTFDIYIYTIEEVSQDMAEKFTRVADCYYCIPEDLEKVCQRIYEDKLDILTYAEIGMLPQTIVMGSMRLAPIQCATIGHPLTTGLENIDYYISRELMEAENAQYHYSEKLILLPNIGMVLEKPNIPNFSKSRKDFNLEEDRVVYLCSQMLFKYLPQHDYIFPAIASQVANAQFVFLETYPGLTEIFKKRLEKAFCDYKLNWAEYCVFLPFLPSGDYLQLNLLCDVFLDSIAWSGDNTTREAIACGLPVVTLPGEFMRSRHSYGILKQIGVTETIASSLPEYIEIAAKLGKDKQWRQEVKQKIIQNHHRLYNDLECVKALAEFYRQARFYPRRVRDEDE